jgi:Tfp pilus assembly protein PilP
MMAGTGRISVIATMLAAALCPTLALAQPPAAKSAAPPAAPVETTSPAPAQPAYSYQTDGRRDPFVSLLGRGSDPNSVASRPAGLPGLLIDELAIKGVMKDRAGFVAMIQGPDNKTYMVHPGEKLMDGSVKSITGDGVVFSQDVNDPLSTVKQRERVKKLRSTEEGRQ